MYGSRCSQSPVGVTQGCPRSCGLYTKLYARLVQTGDTVTVKALLTVRRHYRRLHVLG